MNVAIVYDRVNKFGGAERVLLALHEVFPTAPLYTSVYNPETAKWAEVFSEIHTSFLNRIRLFKTNHEFLFPFMPFIFERFDFSEYDLVISVTSEFAKNINAKKHVCYSLTPTRYLWSHHKEYFGSEFIREIFKPLILYLQDKDLDASEKPTEIVAISTEVQKRIKKYYKRESKIIFPPVQLASYKNFENIQVSASPPDLSKFSPIRQFKDNYYLIVSRLVRYKKVDLVIDAFNELDKPLVIVGSGREERRLKKMANKNIIFLANVSDKELAEIYRGAKGFIFPQEEDFGITAVEAQSFGVPVIAYKRGGILDTVNNETGVFFEKQNKKELIETIKKFNKKKFNKKKLIQNARKFSKKRFKDEFLQFVKNV